MFIENDLKLDFKDVLIKPKRSTLSSRADVNLERTFKFKYGKQDFTGIPIIAANMDTIGTFDMLDAFIPYKMVVALHKHYPIEDFEKLFSEYGNRDSNRYFYSIGTAKDDLIKFNKLKNDFPKVFDQMMICIDVANGYSETFINFVTEFRNRNLNMIIMAGNVVTPEMTEALILAGTDIVKIGIGPGSVCTTRVKTGIGYPQLSAAIECADSAHGLGGHICADGGCTTPGDIAKVFGAGSDFVMLGGMCAGHDECGGELVYNKTAIQEDFKFLKPIGMKFYGMSSETAMEKYSGKVADYRASEGKEITVPYKGPVEDTIKDILGGLRSSCTYVGASTLKEMSKRTTFIRVNSQSNEIFGRN